MKRDGEPRLVGTGSSIRLSRVDLADRRILEAKLQELLDGNPDLLPISRFDGSFSPALSLGREVMKIDNLFLSPSGRLTLVETKLWRNPQAVREVLAQVVDYATRLANLDYESLERRCRDSKRSPVGAEGLYGLVRATFPDQAPSESQFVDRVTRDLHDGRFLLLVVGDGIREGLERMLGALHQQSRLHFTFGLVEMRLYEMPSQGDLLVIPSVVCHSTEIERAVITVRGNAEVQVEVRADPRERAPKLTEQEFLTNMGSAAARTFAERMFAWAREVGSIDLAAKSAALRVPFSTTAKGLILMRIFDTGDVLVTPPMLRRTLRDAEVDEDLSMELARQLKELLPRVELRPEFDKIISAMPCTELISKIDSIIPLYQWAAERAAELDPGTSSGDQDADEDDDEYERGGSSE